MSQSARSDSLGRKPPARVRSLALPVVGAILLISSLFMAAMILSQQSAWTIRLVVDEMTENATPSVANLAEARHELWHLEGKIVRLREALARGAQPEATPVEESLDQFKKDWAAYLTLPTFPGEPALQRRLDGHIERMTSVTRRALVAARANDLASLSLVLDHDVPETFALTASALHELIQFNLRESQSAALRVEALRRSSARFAYALCGLALVVTVVLTAVLLRAIGRLARLQEERLRVDSQERRELAARLRRAEHLGTLGQVVAEVAHELGTPLNVITGRADMLRFEVQGNTEALVEVNAITEQARRITRIIQRLLDYSRERMPTLESVAVANVVQSTIDFLAPEVSAAGLSVTVTGPQNVEARADADLLQQVLFNLLQNAIQASSPEGTVTVEWREASGQVELDVIDDGRGVSPEIADRLFEPFATTKPVGQGTGLGLAISQSIVRQLGGTLRLLPSKGRGAHFRVTLPTSRAASGVEAAARRALSEGALVSRETP